MGARDLLEDLAHAGVTVAADGDRLVIRPASKLTDPMRAALRQCKAEVLALLVPGVHAIGKTRVTERKTAPGMAPPEPSPTPSAARPYRLSPTAADRCHAGGWDEAEIEGFTARVTLFMRRGINATDADDLAESLTLRDRNGDDRRLCLECAHLSGRGPGEWRCRSARAAGVLADLPGDLVTQCQRCPSFNEVHP